MKTSKVAAHRQISVSHQKSRILPNLSNIQDPTTKTKQKTVHLENKRLTFKEECIHQSKSMRLFCDHQQFWGVPWQIPRYKWYHRLRTASAGLRLAQENFSFLESLKTCSRLLEANRQLTGIKQETLVAWRWQGLRKFLVAMMQNQTLTKVSLYARTGLSNPALSRLSQMDIDFGFKDNLNYP